MFWLRNNLQEWKGKKLCVANRVYQKVNNKWLSTSIKHGDHSKSFYQTSSRFGSQLPFQMLTSPSPEFVWLALHTTSYSVCYTGWSLSRLGWVSWKEGGYYLVWSFLSLISSSTFSFLFSIFFFLFFFLSRIYIYMHPHPRLFSF